MPYLFSLDFTKKEAIYETQIVIGENNILPGPQKIGVLPNFFSYIAFEK